MKESRIHSLAVAAIAASLIVLSAGAPNASGSYLLNAKLSLKGDCSVAISEADKVPDPPVEDCESGAHPPAGPFLNSHGVATDLYGNIYVSSYGAEEDGTDGRVDIFDPEGFFISELAVPNGPQNIAVDSQGNLYVREYPNVVNPPRQLSRYTPTVYEPEAGNIEYSPTPTLVVNKTEPFFLPLYSGIAVNRDNDHLFIHYANRIAEFSSAEDGNELLDATMGEDLLQEGKWLTIDAARGRVYASDSESPSFGISRVRVFELAPPHALLETIDGSTVPGGSFGTPQGLALVAVDEVSGHLLVGDMGQRRVIEFDEDYDYVSTTNKPKLEDAEPSQLYVDNGPTSPNQGYFFINSEVGGVSNAYAFEPLEEPEPPEIESLGAGEISETEAELRATIDPNSAATEYVFELTSAEDTEFNEADVVGEGQIDVGNEGAEVSAGASGLSPGTAYRFRVIAVNEKGEDEDEATFSTYPAVGPLAPCPNEALRTGPSVLLPDCRAYELVSPPATNGRLPDGPGGIGGPFPSFPSSPAGDVASFLIDGGALPGTEGTGAFSGENYKSTRTASGWVTELAGPNGTESMSALPGGVSPDQGYTFWSTGKGADEGTARIDGLKTTYLRYPDGHSELIGRGSLGTDPEAIGRLITKDGTHIVFRTESTVAQDAQQLEPNAPPEGTGALYDRVRDPVTGVETTHVVSLLPGDITPAAGQNAIYVGASLDGEGIAFEIGSALYLRSDNEETYEVGTGVEFAGVAEGGERVFYVEGGDLLAFDVSGEEEEVIEFTETGDVTVVNVATEGTRAYFTSPSVLGGENPQGDVAQPGEQNLYLSEEGAISFVGTVTDRDVEGEETTAFGFIDGLGLWTERVEIGWPAQDPSRATPDGTVLLFQSRAELTGLESDEHAQVFRYDLLGDRLHCLSCSPTGATPNSDATLQTSGLIDSAAPLGSLNLLRNLVPDGDRAFFETPEPLVSYDSDGLKDVYEWEEEGVGTCQEEGGCLYLITSGGSARNDYLFAVSESGDDVFFTTADQLLPIDSEPIASIYDARVGGGFAEPAPNICVGEGCHPGMTPPPALPNLESKGPGSQASPKKCPKGKRKVKRHGKVVCVKKKKHKKQNKKQRAAARQGNNR